MAIAIYNQIGRRQGHAATCVAPYKPSASKFRIGIVASVLFGYGSIYDRDTAPSSFVFSFSLMLVTLRFMKTPYVVRYDWSVILASFIQCYAGGNLRPVK